jgi:TM2 domain-containing membrane protein YozV
MTPGGPRIGVPMDQPLPPPAARQGSTGNVVAALVSFFIPGLGQLVQGRPLAAFLFFVGWLLAWCCCLGWVVQIWSTLDAAVWRPKMG